LDDVCGEHMAPHPQAPWGHPRASRIPEAVQRKASDSGRDWQQSLR
jgi:hypothetical protein